MSLTNVTLSTTADIRGHFILLKYCLKSEGTNQHIQTYKIFRTPNQEIIKNKCYICHEYSKFTFSQLPKLCCDADDKKKFKMHLSHTNDFRNSPATQ